MKEDFAIALIDSIKEKSTKKLYSLCNNFNDQKKMGMQSDLTEAKLNEIIIKNCKNFINSIDFDINEYALESVSLRGAKDAVELVKGHSTIFADSVDLLFNKKVGSTSRLSIDVQMPIIIDNNIKINNPLLIKFQEYEESKPVAYPDSITIIDSNNHTLELPICDIDIVKSYLKKNKTDAQNYISDDPWYICDGNMELNNFNLKMNTIIIGDLSIHERLVEIDTNLIVLGKTVANAIVLDDTNDVFLLGGIEFNVALLSMMPGPFRVLKRLKGPLVYTDSDSTSIEGTDNITCYLDYVYGESHGEMAILVKDKYLDKDEDVSLGIDANLVANDIKHGKNIFNHSDSKENFITVKEPDLKDRETVISLLMDDGFYLKELDDEYREDKELIDIAIRYNAETFKYIADHLKNDEDYIYELIKKEGRVLKFVNKRFKKDKKLVLLAIESTAYALANAHKSLRADKEVVMSAINKNALVLKYAEASLQADEDILLASVNNNIDALKYAPPSVIDNEKIMLAVIKKAPKYLSADALSKYLNNKDFIIKALKDNHLVFNYLGKKLQKDEDIRKAAGRI